MSTPKHTWSRLSSGKIRVQYPKNCDFARLQFPTPFPSLLWGAEGIQLNDLKKPETHQREGHSSALARPPRLVITLFCLILVTQRTIFGSMSFRSRRLPGPDEETFGSYGVSVGDDDCRGFRRVPFASEENKSGAHDRSICRPKKLHSLSNHRSCGICHAWQGARLLPTDRET